jgi:prephenate dehydratase
MLRVAYQGAPGAYSEEAAVRLWPHATPVPLRECIDVARAVEGGEVNAGVLAVENTLAGSVVASYDALAACDRVVAVGEMIIGIHHCVLATPGTSLAAIRWVESHPVALAQCGRFFDRHPHLEPRATYDTAGSAMEVARARDPRRAALASRIAAAHYGLEILEADVEDRPDNQTRFVAIARTPAQLADGTSARTILIVTAANTPGALHRLLGPFAEHELNLSKLESRPTGEPWSYRFIVEIEHAAGESAMTHALRAVREMVQSCRIVGTYATAGAPDQVVISAKSSEASAVATSRSPPAPV